MVALPTKFDTTTSPFQDMADVLLMNGYTPIPIMPRDKMPAEYVNGHWTLMSGWNAYSKRKPDEITLARWKTWPDANVGVVLGTMCAGYQLVALDFDTDNQDEIDILQSMIPVSPMRKRGARGFTGFYLAPADLRTKRYMIAHATALQPNKKRTVLEILTGNAPKQTVMPPSIHPNGNAYEWGCDCNSVDEAEIVPIAKLPILTQDHISAIEEALKGFGWTSHMVINSPQNAPLGLRRADNDNRRRTPWREANELALQNLDAWVPALRLLRMRKRSQGYEAVATWRDSQSGNSTEKRKLNLKFHVDGIKDMGTDDGYTAVDVVMRALSLSDSAALDWLRNRLNLPDEGERIAILPAERRFLQTEDNTLEDNTLADFLTGEIVPPSAVNDNVGIMRQRRFPIFRLSDLAGLTVPPREFHVPELIPKNKVTMVAGDGGTGKSLLLLMLAISTAQGSSWLGFDVKQGPVLYLAAEDDRDEIHRRASAILEPAEALFEDVKDLHVVPLAGEDAFLATVNRQTGLMDPTPLFAVLKEAVAELHPSLLVLDTLADLFGGDEIKKEQARSFVAMLNGLAAEFGVTILLLSHPSQSGMDSGRGTSGNTAWSNSVRSRLYLEKHRDDSDLRVLTLKKANYAKPGAQYTLRYEAGRFERLEIHAGVNDLTEVKAEFLRLMEEFARSGRELSSSPCSTYAPKLFTEQPGVRFDKRRFIGAMNELFREEKICNVEVGPPSRRRVRLRLAEPEAAALAAQNEMEGEV